MSVNRIIDANINRSAEGLRVLEDIARFRFNNRQIARDLRKLRHSIRSLFSGGQEALLYSRDSMSDVGLYISAQSKVSGYNTIKDTCFANHKRVQEAFRSIEEQLKTKKEYTKALKVEKSRFLLYSFEKAMAALFRKTLPRGIYGILGEKFSRGKTNIEVAQEMVKAGIDIIQYREKLSFKSLGQIYEECRAIREITKQAGVVFIVNDYADIALMVKADGIHTGQDDLPVTELRKISDTMLIGVSTHNPAQARRAEEDGADYIGAGPVFATSTKEDVCDPVGLEYIDYVVDNINIPFVAIGGIKTENLGQVVAGGAETICLVTEILGADDICRQIATIKRIYRENLK